MKRASLSALCAALFMHSACWSQEPPIALLLAAVPPFAAIHGLGQVYNGENGKAWTASTIDACRSARRSQPPAGLSRHPGPAQADSAPSERIYLE